jgi:DNA-binding protein Fis
MLTMYAAAHSFWGRGAYSGTLEVPMPSFRTEAAVARPPIKAFELSNIDRTNVKRLVGHTLARVECELILQTLESHQGNRTHSATLLGISIRCLRNKIRAYKRRGENVPDSQLAFATEREASNLNTSGDSGTGFSIVP